MDDKPKINWTVPLLITCSAATTLSIIFWIFS